MKDPCKWKTAWGLTEGVVGQGGGEQQGKTGTTVIEQQ